MGGEDVLQLPGPGQPVPDHGVFAGWRHDDAADEEGHVVGGDDAVLHFGDRTSHRFDTQTRVHTS